MASAEDLIKSALRKIGCLGTGEVMEASEAQDALTALNSMLQMWQIDDLLVFSVGVDTFTGVVGTADYEMGTGKTWDTERPSDIVQITIKDGDTEYNPQKIALQEYLNSKRDNNGLPLKYWVNPKYDAQEIKFILPFDKAYSVDVYSYKPLDKFTSLTDNINVPPEYEEAIIWNLAVRLAPEYEKEASATVLAYAQNTQDAIRQQNYTTITLSVDTAILNNYRSNIDGIL